MHTASIDITTRLWNLIIFAVVPLYRFSSVIYHVHFADVDNNSFSQNKIGWGGIKNAIDQTLSLTDGWRMLTKG